MSFQMPGFVCPIPGGPAVLLDSTMALVPPEVAPAWLKVVARQLDAEFGTAHIGGVGHLRAAQEGNRDAAQVLGEEIGYRVCLAQMDLKDPH